MKDYCNLLKHNADARRAHHGGKGVAARRRTNGGVSYEARISKHTIGVSFRTSYAYVCCKRAYHNTLLPSAPLQLLNLLSINLLMSGMAPVLLSWSQYLCEAVLPSWMTLLKPT